MILFEKKPLLRLLFILNNILAVWLSVYDGLDEVAFVILLATFVFMSYISIVKANLLRDERANSVSNFNFDFINTIVFIYNIYEIVKIIK